MIELPWIFLLTRVFIALPFIHSGIFCILNFKDMLKLMESKNLPFPFLGLNGAILLKLLCSFALILGIYDLLMAFVLALFTVVATFIFHDFWNRKGNERVAESFWFTTNMGLIGGLLLLATLSYTMY